MTEYQERAADLPDDRNAPPQSTELPSTGLHDPSLARIASLPLNERAAEYEKLHTRLSNELENAIGQEQLR